MDKRNPISKYSNKELLELCLGSEKIPKDQKELLTEDVIKSHRDQYADALSAVSFVAIIGDSLKFEAQKAATTDRKVVVLMTDDILTGKFRRTQNISLMKKKRSFAFDAETGEAFVFESWGNKVNKKTGATIDPFTEGIMSYHLRTWTNNRTNEEVEVLEADDYTDVKVLTQEDVMAFIKKHNLIKTLDELNSSLMYKLVAIEAKINGVYQVKKLMYNVTTQKYQTLDEMYDYLELSLDTSKTDMVPVLRFDLDLESPVELTRASAEFRISKYGENICLLPDFMALLKSDKDARDTGGQINVKRMVQTVYSDIPMMFIGYLNTYDPAYMTEEGIQKTVVNIKLGAILQMPEGEAEVVPTETTQVKIDVPQPAMELNEFIKDAYGKYHVDLTDKNLLKEMIIDKVKHTYGEDTANLESTVKVIDDLIAK